MITVEIGKQQDAGHGDLGRAGPASSDAGPMTEDDSVDGQLHPDQQFVDARLGRLLHHVLDHLLGEMGEKELMKSYM